MDFKDNLIESMTKMEKGEVLHFDADIEGTLNIYPFDRKTTERRLFKIERVE